MQPNCIIFYL